jgi:DNA-binding transcriptional LysR family regulator
MTKSSEAFSAGWSKSSIKLIFMDINHLRVFVSAFDNRNFTKASKELQIQQTTISTNIKILETEINCKLFDKVGKTMIPTEKAEILYVHSVELLGKVDCLRETIGDIKKEIKGNLTISASSIPGEYLLPRVMSKFKKRYPDVTFQVLISDSTGIIEGICKHEILMGIVETRIDNRQVKYVPLPEDKLIVVSSPSLVESDRMTLKELVRQPIILYEKGAEIRCKTDDILVNTGLSLDDINIAGIFSSASGVKKAVKAGLGISILSRITVADELEQKALKEIKLIDIEMPPSCFFLVTHKRRTLSLIYDIFLRHALGESINR